MVNGDIVDEAIYLFRANVLFRNFEVQGSADRTLIYLTLLIHQVRRPTTPIYHIIGAAMPGRIGRHSGISRSHYSCNLFRGLRRCVRSS